MFLEDLNQLQSFTDHRHHVGQNLLIQLLVNYCLTIHQYLLHGLSLSKELRLVDEGQNADSMVPSLLLLAQSVEKLDRIIFSDVGLAVLKPLL